ncbi:MAG TPA: hypothetical protein PK926_13795 [Spirochaetota bacterium]|nr:hypothetical protein [Spirochaetota bacterium]HPI89409.1 hypothetical protein [Spirochaetota bacterium]HPR49529.1 hypothetical protein [Spirochaetota bacterium]
MEIVRFNLGIDFGTTFTKIAYYDPAKEKAKFILFNNTNDNGVSPFISSNVWFDKNSGRMHVDIEEPREREKPEFLERVLSLFKKTEPRAEAPFF